VILAAAANHRVDRMVVAIRTRRSWWAALKSPVLDDLLHGASTPVLIARPTEPRGGVLVASGLAAPNDAVVSAAAAEAARRGVGLSLLHCVGARPGDGSADPRLRARRAAAARLAAVREQEGVSHVEVLFAQGEVARTILEYEGRLRPELTVVGARRPAHHHMFRRATSARIAGLARGPVLVVPETESRPARRTTGGTTVSAYTAGQS
jgi:nucleotide-binding universal stress UspA family protein